MASNFAVNNIRDFEFIIQEWLPNDGVFNYPQFADYYSKDDIKSGVESYSEDVQGSYRTHQ